MIAKAAQDLRFAILWHSVPNAAPVPSDGASLLGPSSNPHHRQSPLSARASHFDLMLERNDELLTWELLRLPIEGESSTVVRLPNHRIRYLEYEGELSESRGHVIGWERGKLIWQAFRPERLELLLFGTRLTAKIVLEPADTSQIDGAEQTATGSGQLTAEPKLEKWLLEAEIWQLNQE